MTSQHTTDVVVIGAGPVGLFAVFACGQLGLRCHVVDALSEPGGQCTALYPEKPIYDIPGFPKVLGRELISRLKEQAHPYKPTFSLGTLVNGLKRIGSDIILRTTRGETLRSKAVIVAAGAGAFGPNRPPLAGIEALEGSSVHYWVGDPDAFRGKHVVIAGGGDSAVDWANLISPGSASLTLVHRRQRFRATPSSLDELARLANCGKVRVLTPYQLESLAIDNGKLAAVVVADLDGREERLAADVLLPFFGLSSDLSALDQFGFTVVDNGIPTDPLTMETKAPGLFAIGDVATYPHKEKLIVTGFAEASRAARSALAYAYPERPYHFQHSTDRGAPVETSNRGWSG
ncbi:NAD(P)/FAD-dependent oxidoreductase [Hyphomicrobium sp.]|uniref:NAD(P)/FAD-dependent oxidoreductase n=1 Tax=Hyphomicrobium sp. TaxID=82 RepID=UPI002E376E2E|nr:NAD(P)/FAD-dependent oxidoreductase [Hyphomicrobium sp.]HEX2843590.1 NAD(P)/FAD-dependent oxidoreductase [Hyphomicrobium sp.]